MGISYSSYSPLSSCPLSFDDRPNKISIRTDRKYNLYYKVTMDQRKRKHEELMVVAQTDRQTDRTNDDDDDDDSGGSRISRTGWCQTLSLCQKPII